MNLAQKSLRAAFVGVAAAAIAVSGAATAGAATLHHGHGHSHNVDHQRCPNPGPQQKPGNPACHLPN